MHWGRAHRGRVWHVIAYGDDPLNVMVAECGQQDMKESCEGKPPNGARVCHDCGRAVLAKAKGVQLALKQSISVGFQTLADAVLEPPADAEQLTDFLLDGTRLTPELGIDLLVEAQPEAPTLAEEKDDEQRIP